MAIELRAQRGCGVRCEWGPFGAARADEPAGAVVVVDVLSFSTSVSVAVERGTAVHPIAWKDARAAQLAAAVGAELAVGRHEVTAQRPWSLSPAALRGAPVAERLVLPSPNGSTIAAAARGTVLAACLRNAGAVAAWLRGHGYGTPDFPVTVVPAGERWPDGSLRPALEDHLGAGAVVAALARGGQLLSAEAAAARDLYVATPSVPDAVRRCDSGLELVDLGFAEDVEVAVEVDAGTAVPLLVDGAFRAAPA